MPYEKIVPVASRRGSRALLGAALAMLVVTLTPERRAAAEGQRPLEEALTIGPHECLTSSRLAPDLERLIGRGTLDRRISVEVTAETGGVKVTIFYEGAERGVRHIKDEPQCSDYVGVVAISVAMALDALVPREAGEPIDAAADAPVGEVRLELDASVDARVAPPSPPHKTSRTDVDGRHSVDRPLLPSVRVLTGMTSNVLPVQAWSFATAVDLRTAPLGMRWRLESGLVFPSDVSVGASNVIASALFARAGGCVLPLPADLRPLRVCAGLLAGAVLARGTASGFARSSILPLAHGDIGFELATPISHGLGLVLGIDGLVGLVRPDLVVAAPDHRVLARRRPDVVGVLVGVGLEWND